MDVLGPGLALADVVGAGLEELLVRRADAVVGARVAALAHEVIFPVTMEYWSVGATATGGRASTGKGLDEAADELAAFRGRQRGAIAMRSLGCRPRTSARAAQGPRCECGTRGAEPHRPRSGRIHNAETSEAVMSSSVRQSAL